MASSKLNTKLMTVKVDQSVKSVQKIDNKDNEKEIVTAKTSQLTKTCS